MWNLRLIIGFACLFSAFSGLLGTEDNINIAGDSYVEQGQRNNRSRRTARLFPFRRQVEEQLKNAGAEGLQDEQIASDAPLKSFFHRTKEIIANGGLVGLEGLGGKNIASMMNKIEGILKDGVKPAVPSDTHDRGANIGNRHSDHGDNDEFTTINIPGDTHYGGSHPRPGGGHPNPGGSYPNHGGSHPNPGGSYPNPGGSYPHTGGSYPRPGASYPNNYHYGGSVSPAEKPNLYGDKDKYNDFYFKTKEHSHGQPYPHKGHDIYDLKNIWLAMLYDVYQILNDDNILKNSGSNTKTLEKIFSLLWDIDLIEPRKKKHSKCPYGFNQAGDLCLSVEFIAEKLKWEDARLYCQVVKGGDLVIFKNTCEFRQTIEFLQEIDKKRHHSYWVGATDLDREDFWKFVDGSNVPRGAGLWGTRMGKLEPSGGDNQDLGILLASDYWYMHDISDDLALGHLEVIPLCQYVPERDGFVAIPTKPTGLGPYAAYDDNINNEDYHTTKPDYRPQTYQPNKGYNNGYVPSPYNKGYVPSPYNKGSGPSPYKRTASKTKTSQRTDGETDTDELSNADSTESLTTKPGGKQSSTAFSKGQDSSSKERTASKTKTSPRTDSVTNADKSSDADLKGELSPTAEPDGNQPSSGANKEQNSSPEERTASKTKTSPRTDSETVAEKSSTVPKIPEIKLL